jgi:aryl-alcohol dehydrogenase-like predicted oxidoreductase
VSSVSKLALGTVQFGTPYGINNNRGVIAPGEVYQILSLANRFGIKLLDTAPAYGDAERMISKFASKFKIVTKISGVPTGDDQIHNLMFKQVDTSLARFEVSRVFGILLHRPMQLLEKEGQIIYSTLQKLKSEGLVEKIGVSIYEPSELDKLSQFYDFDIVQAPLNIFDRRLQNSGWMERLDKMGVELHVRSVFLQGLLLVEPEKRHPKFERWGKLFKQYDTWLTTLNMSRLEANIRYALSFATISNVIVGIDGIDHLESIISAVPGPAPQVPDDLYTNDINLINPLSWLNF